MQGKEDSSAGGQWLAVVGDRDEDRHYRRSPISENAGGEVVVDDSGIGGGLCGVLFHVFRRGAEVCGPGPCAAGTQRACVEDVRTEGLSHHRFHDFAGDFAQAYSRHPGTFLRLVLPGSGSGLDFGRRPVPDPVVERQRGRRPGWKGFGVIDLNG